VFCLLISSPEVRSSYRITGERGARSNRNVFRYDLARINATGTWRLPIPARYVIDRNGIIVDAEVNPDNRYRPDPEVTLAVIAGLTAVSERFTRLNGAQGSLARGTTKRCAARRSSTHRWPRVPAGQTTATPV
jgi:hypothetical protein